MASFIGDPSRIRLWLRLHAAAESITNVAFWKASDGGDPARLRGHQHVVPTLVICLEGVIRVQGRVARDLRAGEALVIAPGCWHEHVMLRRGAIAFGLGFLARRCDILLADHRETSWGTINDQPFRLWMERLLQTGSPAPGVPCASLPTSTAPSRSPVTSASASASAPAARAQVMEMVAQIFAEKASPIHWLHPAVSRMAKMLWSRLHTPITAADIVRAARARDDGLGHTRAYELFTTFFGETPKQVLTGQRLALAGQFLREGATIADAARRSGFSTRAGFTRSWRRLHGRPPRSGGAASLAGRASAP